MCSQGTWVVTGGADGALPAWPIPLWSLASVVPDWTCPRALARPLLWPCFFPCPAGRVSRGLMGWGGVIPNGPARLRALGLR